MLVLVIVRIVNRESRKGKFFCCTRTAMTLGTAHRTMPPPPFCTYDSDVSKMASGQIIWWIIQETSFQLVKLDVLILGGRCIFNSGSGIEKLKCTDEFNSEILRSKGISKLAAIALHLKFIYKRDLWRPGRECRFLSSRPTSIRHLGSLPSRAPTSIFC